MPAKYTYLLLMLLTIVGPLAFSFDKRMHYYKQWKYLAFPFLLTAAYFIIWDYFFTKTDIWSFNDHYILGHKILLLPIEEWMFFFCVPFSCLFIYECVHYYSKKDLLKNYALKINLFVLLIITIVAIFNIHKAYTAVNFISAAIVLGVVQLLRPGWLGKFYVAYLFSLIPFFIVNGILTYLPVVRYNDSQNLGIRIFTIPVEDTVYCLLLLMMNVAMYEWIKNYQTHRTKKKLP